MPLKPHMASKFAKKQQASTSHTHNKSSEMLLRGLSFKP
jgi:hypothetical protein